LLDALYKHLHSHPEISFQEENTAKRIADELTKSGFEVTQKVGGHGVVGVLRNGAGPTILLRTDLDALPVKEQTDLAYASKVRTRDDKGNEVDVMHACGHDIHMTVFVGTARLLAQQVKDKWQGTLVMIGQPAEERVGGAKAMIADGLFTRFPKPDFCLALHVDATLPAGTVGYVEGYAMANVDSMDIIIRGAGGHGAWPHTTKDPIVLAAQTILALQTIVSRETEPIEPAVVTVGSIHGGTKYNIIPDDVRLQLTLRSYSEQVRTNTISSIKRITRGLALAAGVPEARVTRWALVMLGVFVAIGVLGVATARFFGKSGSRLSIQVSIVAQWLGAYVLWSFAAGLAAKYRLITEYEAGWFVLFAVVVGWWHYRVRVSAGAERGLAIFVGAQLVWLAMILVRNGVLGP